MKKLNQHSLLLAAALLTAGVANAQTPTNQFTHAPRAVYSPEPQNGPNSTPTTAGANTPNGSYTGYSQDSYIEQTGNSNYSKVDQADGRTGALAAGSGSSAVVSQSGSYNNAFQNQTLNNSSNVASGRNLLRSTQAGTYSQSNQTQNNGYSNTAEVNQLAGSSYNRATQTQTDGHDNGAIITQSNAGGGLASSQRNTAEQMQTGGTNNLVRIDQQGNNSYAKQTQAGTGLDGYIGQGAPGANNTAIQDQTGSFSNASIKQSVGLPAANNNYALQNQHGFGEQAVIDQKSSGNFARQDQAGTGSYYQNNNSLISQSNVSSAAYTTQTGNLNTATVTQH